MKVAVWDTYIKKKNGTVMNFDIIVPDSQKSATIIYGYGKNIWKVNPSLITNLHLRNVIFVILSMQRMR